jgi:hypothetical protein
MADTTKLSVGKALEKLRGTDEPRSKMSGSTKKLMLSIKRRIA